MGLVVRAVPRDELDTEVDDLVASILANSRGSLLAYKDLYRTGAERALDAALGYEAATQFAIDDTAERLEGFR